MKKILSVFAFLLCALAISAQETATIDGINYNLENGKATIAAQPTTLSGNITIPEKVTYNGATYTVSGMADYAFQKTKITSITIPNSITSLGNDCFSACTNLTSITLPNSITSLGSYCFSGCTGLTSITLPNSITSLGKFCFDFCTSLTSITLPNSITSLGGYCFFYCKRLTSITLPNSITSLGNNCFESCTSLMKVTCQWESLDKISSGEKAFDNIYSEAKLYVPKGTTAIYKEKEPWSKFKYIIENDGSAISTQEVATIDGIEYYLDNGQATIIVQPATLSGDITIPEKVTYNGATYTVSGVTGSAFYGTQITSITLPNGITSLGYCCFSVCTSLTSITLPSSITSLGEGCFWRCI